MTLVPFPADAPPRRIWYQPGDTRRWYPAKLMDYMHKTWWCRVLGFPAMKDHRGNSNYPLSWGQWKPRRKRFSRAC